MNRIAMSLVTSLVYVSGCRATPYQRLVADSSEGYSDKNLGEDMFLIRFAGNASTDDATLCRYLYRRAAEVALKSGYSYFTVVRPPRHTTEVLQIYTSEDQAKEMLRPTRIEQPDPSTMVMTIRCFRQSTDHDAGLIDAKQYLSRHGQ